jgi:hypothetical protein
MRIAALALTACSVGGTPLANRVPEPDEVHVVVAPALGFTGEVDEPVGWRLERTGDHATLTITKRDHRELRYRGPVRAQGGARRYDLERGPERVSLVCERTPVQVHAVGARPLARPEPVRCDEPPPWEPAGESTVVALRCTFESPTAARRLLTFAPPPGFDAVKDQCCVGDVCEIRWDIRMR